jgi:hypothetical protein
VAVQMLIAFADDTNLSAKIRYLLIVSNYIRLEKPRYMATTSIFAHECFETFQFFECNQSNEHSISASKIRAVVKSLHFHSDGGTEPEILGPRLSEGEID